MIDLPKLSPRLSAVASFARQGKRIADIGTDHAFVPVYLTLAGISLSAIAADVKTGPLLKAEQTIKKYKAENKVKTLLSDGLENIDEASADDIIIAGMGGETIIAILKACSFLHTGDRRLILQPMTDIPELRGFLYENGFIIEQELIAKEGKKLYVIMLCKSGKAEMPSLADICFGNFKKIGENERLYLEKLIKEYEKTLFGLNESSNPDILRKNRTKEILNALYSKRSEIDAEGL